MSSEIPNVERDIMKNEHKKNILCYADDEALFAQKGHKINSNIKYKSATNLEEEGVCIQQGIEVRRHRFVKLWLQ